MEVIHGIWMFFWSWNLLPAQSSLLTRCQPPESLPVQPSASRQVQSFWSSLWIFKHEDFQNFPPSLPGQFLEEIVVYSGHLDFILPCKINSKLYMSSFPISLSLPFLRWGNLWFILEQSDAIRWLVMDRILKKSKSGRSSSSVSHLLYEIRRSWLIHTRRVFSFWYSSLLL